MKHREYPIALKQAAVARVAAWESIAEVVRDLKLRGRLLYTWRDKVRTGGPAALRERIADAFKPKRFVQRVSQIFLSLQTNWHRAIHHNSGGEARYAARMPRR